MRRRMSNRTLIFHLPLFQTLSSKSRRSNRHIKYFCDGSTDSTFVSNLITKYHIISHNTSLTISRICQIIQPRFPGQWMRIFNSIPYSINIFCRSFQIFIYPDTTCFTYLQSGLFSQSRCRAHSDRKQYHICRNRFSTFQKDGNTLFCTLEMSYSFFQIERHTFLYQMLMNRRSHRKINRRHYLITHFHNRYGNSGMMQIFCHLQSNKARTYYNRSLYGVFRKIRLYMIGIFDITESENSFRIDTFQWWSNRCSTRRQQKFIIGFFIFATVCSANSNRFIFRMNSDNFILHTYIYTKALAERSRRLHQQFLTLCDDTTYIIRQAAICIRNVFPFLK